MLVKFQPIDIHMPKCWNGRHNRLKICCPQGRAGSSPALGTIIYPYRLTDRPLVYETSSERSNRSEGTIYPDGGMVDAPDLGSGVSA